MGLGLVNLSWVLVYSVVHTGMIFVILQCSGLLQTFPSGLLQTLQKFRIGFRELARATGRVLLKIKPLGILE